jgi:hypothetical protein
MVEPARSTPVGGRDDGVTLTDRGVESRGSLCPALEETNGAAAVSDWVIGLDFARLTMLPNG